MKTHRFFIEQKIEDTPEIIIANPNIIHQMKNVLRLQPGDPIILLDGTGIEYHAKVKVLLKKESIFSKEKIKKVDENLGLKLDLVPAIIKKDKYEWVLQKCTEIGVNSFSPVISERTEKTKVNMSRAEVIVKEAAEQSERNTLPIIKEPVSLEKFLENMVENNMQNIYVLDFCETKIDVSHLKSQSSVTLLIGPEGGWGEEDIKLFDKYSVKRISLGEQILRAETASVAVSSLLMLG